MDPPWLRSSLHGEDTAHDLGSIYPVERGWMKSHVLLIGRMLEDLGIRCCTSTTRDLETITSRVKDEGFSFLAITLPTFGKDFERCLDQGSVDSTAFQSFRNSACLPAFLQGFTSLVFDKETGVLLDEPCVDAILAVRQISYLFKRFEADCTPARERSAFDGFVECDIQVGMHASKLSDREVVDFARSAHIVLSDVFHRVDQMVAEFDLRPKHGPGATADFLKANAKWNNRLWTRRLEDAGFYAGDHLYPAWSHFLNDESGTPIWLEPEDEIPVRVVSVPKTLKTPRIIAIEPTHNQYVQQSLKTAFYETIEGHDYLSRIIGFSDQERNHTLACQGSREGSLATLDLSEASDRVSNRLVRAMLANTPHLHEAVAACRSERADVPGHGVIPLFKFASMGSALTFPVEAMVFTTIIFMGIAKKLRTPLTRDLVKRYSSQVRVYGDDLIVPVDCVHSVIRELEAYGLKVNENKSFWTGKFRESCGKDFYDGVDVSVVKVKAELPSSRKHAREIKSTVDFRNHCYINGHWRTAEYLDRGLEKIIPFPRVDSTSQGMGRYSHLGFDVERECPTLQRPLVRAAVLHSTSPNSPLDGIGALLKFFLTRIETRDQGKDPFNFLEGPVLDKDHLARAGRPEVVNIKLRWVSPY